jgi:glucosamine--fructose-6-phosphate aminotransferase (isomerizing)
MCGIVGYTGQQPVLPILLKGLQRLEYRGYDSTGVAFFQGQKIEIIKQEGRLSKVSEIIAQTQKLNDSTLTCGIGHTRWATHGKPSTQNAHPHRTGHVVLVHNGIIENYQEIKKELIEQGHEPLSQTDSELFGFLVLDQMKLGEDLKTAVRQAFKKIQGACSVVVMSENEPGVIVGVRQGSPLVAAYQANQGVYLASDAQPLLEYSKQIYYLEEDDMVVGRFDQNQKQGTLEFYDLKTGQKIQRESTLVEWSSDQIGKQGFEHYMLKEIYEQPTALLDTLNALCDRSFSEPFEFIAQPGVEILKSASELILIACGTSWHAALMGKYWIEKFARIPVQVELASEFRYRNPLIREGAVVMGITQSGETADTLAVIKDLKKKKIKTLGLTNVRGSSITREADATFFIAAGPEIGVAATKTFTSQMLALLLMAGVLSRHERSGLTESDRLNLFEQCLMIPHHLQQYLNNGITSHEPAIESVIQRFQAIAPELAQQKGFFFIGRGFSFPMSLEAALKLKEIAYVHAEGYAAGELKHGPIAMIDQEMVVVVLAPQDFWRDKTVSNLEEVKARGAKILAIGSEKDESLKTLSDWWIPLPEAINEALLPFWLAVGVQLLSYTVALQKGTDVDKPRNLAKSVTVE